jgi:hypothetical protein
MASTWFATNTLFRKHQVTHAESNECNLNLSLRGTHVMNLDFLIFSDFIDCIF